MGGIAPRFGYYKSFMTLPPLRTSAVLEPGSRPHALHLRADTRGLVLIVHADAQSAGQPGQRFVADVLRANRFAVLSCSLRTAAEQAAPGKVEAKHRLRDMLGWAAAQVAAKPLPIALIGVADAVPACIAVAQRQAAAALSSLVLQDGRPSRVPLLLARLRMPALLVVGAHDARTLAAHRAALLQVPAGSRLELLAQATQPVAEAGAHEAFACAALAWLMQTLPRCTAPQAAMPHKAFTPQ